MGSEFNKRAVASNKPIWSSEDWSSDGTEEGGGCMAQVSVLGCHDHQSPSELSRFYLFSDTEQELRVRILYEVGTLAMLLSIKSNNVTATFPSVTK